MSDVNLTLVTERGSVNVNNKKSWNLTKLEHNKNIPGDISGANNTGISESSSGQADTLQVTIC